MSRHVSRVFLLLLLSLAMACSAEPSKEGDSSPNADVSDPIGPSDAQPAPASPASDDAVSEHIKWDSLVYFRDTSGPFERMRVAFDGQVDVESDSEAVIFAGFVGDPELRQLREMIDKHFTETSETGKCEGKSKLIVQTRHFSRASRESCLTEKNSLTDMLDTMFERHRPNGMSGRCAEAIRDFERTYSGLKTCEVASDCAYIDEDYLPFDDDRSSEAGAAADDCLHLRPLAVANGFEVVSRQLSLLKRRDLVLRICGRALYRQECSRNRKVSVHRAPPLCVKGSCRDNSTLRK